MVKRSIHCHGHNTRLITPKETKGSKAELDARIHGEKCFSCGQFNLPHRRVCFNRKCKVRLKPSDNMIKNGRIHRWGKGWYTIEEIDKKTGWKQDKEGE